MRGFLRSLSRDVPSSHLEKDERLILGYISFLIFRKIDRILVMAEIVKKLRRKLSFRPSLTEGITRVRARLHGGGDLR